MNTRDFDVAQCGLFTGLNQNAISFILSKAEMIQVAKGEIIIREQQPGDCLYVIAQGTVLIEKDGVEVSVLGKGDQFGEMFVIEIMPRSANALALEPCELLKLTVKDMLLLRKKYYDAFIEILLNCSRDISAKLRRMTDRYVALHKPVPN